MSSDNQSAVIWDMDGTLVDTGELHFQAWVKMAAKINKPFSRDDFNRTFGLRNPEIIPQIFGDEHDDAEIERIGNHKEAMYREEAKLGVELLPGARILLQALHEAGFKQAVGSSAPRDNLELILEMTGSHQFFAATASMEDVSSGKPDPEVFLKAAEKIGVRPQACVVIEDAPAGVMAAKAGGMKCVGVTFVGHHSSQILKDAGADLVVQSLEHLSVDTMRNLLADA